MINIVIFGKPGAGKGTQANLLKEKYKLVHISTGILFRNHIKLETKLGKLAKFYIDKGDLVPDEVTINMLQEEVDKNPEANGFIFDGFPRTIKQAETLDDFLAVKKMKIDATIALEAGDDELTERLLERGKDSGRTDDQDPEKIKNRFEEYRKKTETLVAYYKKQQKFYTVNGIGDIDEITERLSKVMDKLINNEQ